MTTVQTSHYISVRGNRAEKALTHINSANIHFSFLKHNLFNHYTIFILTETIYNFWININFRLCHSVWLRMT